MLRQSTPEGNGQVYQDWCMVCCCGYHPVMLTGYCLTHMHYDNCGRLDDLSIVKVEVSRG